MQYFRVILLLLFSTVLAKKEMAQTDPDTVRLSLVNAEKIFIQNNLSLLASRFNIDANRALIKQAKLWDNPTLVTDQNLYDKQGGFFKHDQNSGQFYIQVTQLIKTAGKRSKLAQLATDNTTISDEQFNDLLRSLRYSLRSDLIEIHHQLQVKKIYDAEIIEVNNLARAMDLQLAAGNVSVKDNLRIKALLFSLQNELVNVEAQMIPIENEIRFLLNNKETRFIVPELGYKFSDLTAAPLPATEDLVKQALALRPDAKMAQSLVDLQNHNLIYQKALAKPDISIGTEFDQHSSYAPDYVGLTISLPLNIFNHNQGNIASAKFSLQQQKVLSDQTGFKIQQDISSSLEKMNFYKRVNNFEQVDFSNKYDALFINMLKSYKDRQLNLLDFIDFMDAYKDTKLKLIEQQNGLIKAIEDLNFAVGSDIVKLD